MTYRTIKVKLDGARYDIIIGKGLLPDCLIRHLNIQTKNKKVVIVFDSSLKNKACDRMLDALEKAGYEAYGYAMESGKHNKTMNRVMDIYKILEMKGLSRDSTLIAVGGGVIGDLAGFVASTYLRGINFINIPTTLMAMIDSSIGGKVAVNFRKTINAIGNYYHPKLIIIDFEFLKSLPDRDYKSGLAEIIKCAIISDKKLFDYLNTRTDGILERKQDDLSHIMSRAIEIKLDHVSGDVREQNKRLKLNYGHTIGHAIEVSTDGKREIYRHGEGVSLGMIGAAFLSERYFPKSGGILRKHEAILLKYGLPTTVRSKKIKFECDKLRKECLKNIYKDKKRKDNRLRWILSDRIGHCGVYSDIPDGLIAETFKYLIEK